MLLGRNGPVHDVAAEDLAERAGEVVVAPRDVAGEFVGLPRWSSLVTTAATAPAKSCRVAEATRPSATLDSSTPEARTAERLRW